LRKSNLAGDPIHAMRTVFGELYDRAFSRGARRDWTGSGAVESALFRAPEDFDPEEIRVNASDFLVRGFSR
jgi:hypothetical protein